MRRESVAEKKSKKGFYSRGFRYAVNALVISIVLNLMLSGAIHGRLIHRGDSTYYSTDGVHSPIQLSPLDAPNFSSTPLLPESPPDEMTMRELPDGM